MQEWLETEMKADHSCVCVFSLAANNHTETKSINIMSSRLYFSHN